MALLPGCPRTGAAAPYNDTHGDQVTPATGDIRSKDAAADWALERLPAEHRPLMARARDVYLGEEREHWDDLLPGVRLCAGFLVRAIEEAQAS